MPRPWKLRRPDPDLGRRLVRESGVHGVVANLLVNRGHTDPDAARTHLACSADGLHEPLLMPGMQAACTRLLRAIADGETILGG